MGYNTTFEGQLNFRDDVTLSEIKAIQKYLVGDWGDAERVGPGPGPGDYAGFKVTDDMTGIEWDGCEKLRDVDSILREIMEMMIADYPDFTLTGTVQAQGEDTEDRWDLVGEGSALRVFEYRFLGEIVSFPASGEFKPTETEQQ